MVELDANKITASLHSLQPEHDTAVGLIHPYWARKPLNVIQKLVTSFSEEGDLVVDPFVGSGTTVFAALSTKRRVIGADLNPLAIFITQAITSLRYSPTQKLSTARFFVDAFCSAILPWFHYRDDLYVERERFRVDGVFENGDFRLIPSEVVLKSIKDGVARGRYPEAPNERWIRRKPHKTSISQPIDFKKLSLIPNSRIAIPNGASLDHFYAPKNQAAINIAIDLIQSNRYPTEDIGILRLMLSAALPLLRLSDKKASSQWPYWRPKDQLTSRNPIFVMKRKLVAIEQAAVWLSKNVADDIGNQLEDYLQLYTTPVQSLVPNYIAPGQADLVLTDPPYSDQAPYLEYSSLWIQLLGLSLPKDAYSYEIVKTDAPERTEDSEQYAHRLSEGLKSCAQLLKINGIMIWFYQDHQVEHWAMLNEEALRNGLHIVDVIPLEKQRRSMKTVTSPGRTLDGDLVLIFRKKSHTGSISKEPRPISHVLQMLSQALAELPDSSSYFEKYATIINYGLKNEVIGTLATEFSDIREILRVINYGD